MIFKVFGLDQHNLWKDCLNQLPEEQQDIYFMPEYYSLSEKNGEGKANCIFFEKNNEKIVYPFLINSINNLGYNLDKEYFDIQGAYGYNGVLSSCYDINFVNSFYNIFNQYCLDNNIIAEFTRFHPILKNHTFSLQKMDVLKDRKTVFLSLFDENDLWMNSYSSRNRNMIRKAQKNDVRITESDDFDFFYNIYTNTMVNVNADSYYMFDKQYFNEYQNDINSNQKLFVANYKNERIAAVLIMFYKQYAHYHLSARDNNFSNIPANNLLLDHAIKYVKSKGCKYFHFGGGKSSDENDPLLKFKLNFSKEFADFFIGKKIHNMEVYDKVVQQWILRYPEKEEKYSNFLLKYRY